MRISLLMLLVVIGWCCGVWVGLCWVGWLVVVMFTLRDCFSWG